MNGKYTVIYLGPDESGLRKFARAICPDVPEGVAVHSRVFAATDAKALRLVLAGAGIGLDRVCFVYAGELANVELPQEEIAR